jgi:DNA-binding response OmpR family regulator
MYYMNIRDLKKILIVDDEDELRQVVREVLEMNDYAVDEASNGDSAIAKLGSAFYHVVLLDINLPGHSGYEVLRFAKRKSPQTKVIMLTGVVGLDAAIRSASSGADDYVAKPFDVQYLLQSIRTVLTNHQAIRE